MDNELNTTQTPAQTDNPQDAANPGASNAEDFQSTAPSEALNQETENLSVEKTGDPITGSATPAAESFPTWWVIGIAIVVVVGIWVLIKLFKEEVSERAAPVQTSKPKAAAAKTAAKKPAKKSPAKKKPAAKSRKKTTKKKR